MKLDIKKLEFLKGKLEDGINVLDALYKDIWSLNFKDFEDLKHALVYYEETYDNTDDILLEIQDLFDGDYKAEKEFIWDLSQRLLVHGGNIDYLRTRW